MLMKTKEELKRFKEELWRTGKILGRPREVLENYNIR